MDQNSLASLCPIVRRLDEHRKRAKCLADLFDDQANAWRQELVEKCEQVIFDDQDSVNTKPREILWRKGYYDTIAMAKRFMHAQLKHVALAHLDGVNHLAEFIEEGIARLKKIIVRIENDYNLDLRYLVDFSLFGAVDVVANHGDVPINKKITSLEIINFALESIHALIVALGDLNRYYLDFGLNTLFNNAITKQRTALYYEEAFKLNPQNGMPQNQLGTLWIGRSCNLDSVYYYLYSLVCPKPFELSEDNVVRLFHQNSAYLETINMDEDYQVNLKDFIARFLLIVDIFFFDKSVPTFNDLCGFLLCDLNSMLQRKDKVGFDQDVLFKITTILFFCMRKLKKTNSPTLYHLNAFLAAICDQFVDSCNTSFEEFFKMHEQENLDYQSKYTEAYSMYQEANRGENGKGLLGKPVKALENGNHELSSNSTTDGVSQEVYGASSAEIKSNEKSGDSREPKGRSVLPKKAVKYRRRRRRSTYSSDSESDLTSNFDSDSEASDGSSDEDESDEDIDSEEEEVDQEVFKNSHGQKRTVETFNNFSDEENDSDILIEEETLVLKNQQDNSHFPEEKANRNSSVRGVAENGLETNFTALNFHDELISGVEKKSSGTNRLRKKMFLSLYDPNLVLKFASKEPTIRALKVLLDWLMGNKEIVWECHQSNPQFLEKIMSLLNAVTLNICTRKVFFHRRLLTAPGLREDIQSLFEVRSKMPITEDLVLKHFAEFVDVQMNLDWEMPAQLNVTPAEIDLLRLFKLRNFGFFISDRRKFGYGFLNCRFEPLSVDQMKKRKSVKETARQTARRAKQGERNGWKGGSCGEGKSGGRKLNQKSRSSGNDKSNESRGRRTNSGSSNNNGGSRRNRRNKANAVEAGDGDLKAKDGALREKEMLKKGELMKKLWLRNEVKTLESRMRGPKAMELMTPYAVVDAKALVDHLAIVRQLVRMEKFIVLIPSGVLADLDGLKGDSDRARECIRWLDRTISNGSRFLRTQVATEQLLIPDYVKPRHGGRTEISRFIQIAEFCHYMTDKYKIDGQAVDVLTLLTGEDLTQKDPTECDYLGILRSIAVKFETIVKFYGKLIKK